MEKLLIYVLGHEDAALAAIPKGVNVKGVDLRTLEIADQWNSNLYAEARFLLSEDAAVRESEYVGVVSTSYEQKWPDHPSIQRLTRLTRGKSILRPNRVFAPVFGAETWIEDSDQNHPGMQSVLGSLIEEMNLTLKPTRAPYANTFLCHREVFDDLRGFMRQALAYVLEQYGTDVPFEYRCPACQTQSRDGFGRYQRDRHMGFLAERITMLFFSQRSDLSVHSTKYVFPSKRPRIQLGVAYRKLPRTLTR